MVRLLCKIVDTSALQVIKATAIVSVFLLMCVSGLDSVLSTTSQDKEVDSKIWSTTTCMGLVHMSESEADARLLSDGNNIKQHCEQVIRSDDGNDLTSNNYAKNEVIVDDERTEEGGNLVNQQSKQKIDLEIAIYFILPLIGQDYQKSVFSNSSSRM